MIAQTLLLYIAGHETTVNLIAGGTLALLRHPDQLTALREDPALVIDNAVEELLRYDSPVQASGKITVEPVTISGVAIPAGAFGHGQPGLGQPGRGFWGADAAEGWINRENARQHVSLGADAPGFASPTSNRPRRPGPPPRGACHLERAGSTCACPAHLLRASPR